MAVQRELSGRVVVQSQGKISVPWGTSEPVSTAPTGANLSVSGPHRGLGYAASANLLAQWPSGLCHPSSVRTTNSVAA